MSGSRRDRRAVVRYPQAPPSVAGWLLARGRDGAGRAGEAAAARWRGVRDWRGWWIGPTGAALIALGAWAALGPASVGTSGLGPSEAEGRAIDLTTGVPPEEAFADDASAEGEAETESAKDPRLVINLREVRENKVLAIERAAVERAERAKAEAESETEAQARAEAESEPVASPTHVAGPAPSAIAAAAASAEPAVSQAWATQTIDASLASVKAEQAWPAPRGGRTVALATPAASASSSPPSAPATAAVVASWQIQAEVAELLRPTPPPPPAESRTQRVVFMVDLSGSLIDSLPEAVRWIGEALDGLDQPAVFTVLFFRQGEVIEAPPFGLKPATFAMKWEAYDWMRPENGHVEAGGKATLSDAVLAALRYEVDRVVLLSDDGFGRGLSWHGGPTLLDEIALVLPNERTTIDTVQFFYRDAAGAMEAIADRFGGEYLFIAQALPDDEPAFVDLYGKLRTR